MTHNLAPIRSLGLAALVVAALPSAALAQTPSTKPSGDTPFNSMAIATDEADDMQTAVDRMLGKLERQLHDHKAKMRSH